VSLQQLHAEPDKFGRRRLEEPYPYLILDARYEEVRETVQFAAKQLAAIGNWKGRRNVLAAGTSQPGKKCFVRPTPSRSDPGRIVC
jgi:transposase-like protein